MGQCACMQTSSMNTYGMMYVQTQVQPCEHTNKILVAFEAIVRFSVSVVVSDITEAQRSLSKYLAKNDCSCKVHVDAILGYLERKVSTGLLE